MAGKGLLPGPLAAGHSRPLQTGGHMKQTGAGELGEVCNGEHELSTTQLNREQQDVSTSCSLAERSARQIESDSAADNCFTVPGLMRRQSKLGKPQQSSAACLESISQTRQGSLPFLQAAPPWAGIGCLSAAEAIPWQATNMHSAVQVSASRSMPGCIAPLSNLCC